MTAPLEIDICADCLYTDANGWDERTTGRPLPDPAPLSHLDGFLIGGYQSDGNGYLEPSFSWSPCDGCGCTLGGDRYAVTIVEAPHAVCGIDDTTCQECSA